MRKVILLLNCLLAAFVVEATHIRCGHISVSRTNDLTYKITLKVYTNFSSAVKFGAGTLDFGDGSAPHITPSIDNVAEPGLGANIGSITYSINHTFPDFGSYVVTYTEHNLDQGILNISNSVETPFYLETQVLLQPGIDASSPDLLTSPIFKFSANQQLAFSTAAADKKDNQLTYELIVPGKVSNFQTPENISINFFNGLVTWEF